MWPEAFIFTQLFLWAAEATTSQVCYDHIGCFSNAAPYANAFGYLPQSPEEIGITFHLHTRANAKQHETLDPNGDATSVSATHFDGTRKTVFICHGFHGLENNTWINQMTDAFLKAGDFNVIVIVWTKGAFADYNTAAANTRVVGAVTANLVKLLHSVGQLPYNKVHLIGHSLGAHVCGYVGRRVPGIARITGLDPAGPEFRHADHRVILDSSDAAFVDVIHTDTSLGFHNSIGHVDFYPNGGEFQPGCLYDALAGPFYSCSHMRSVFYFIESINRHCHFTARPCLTDEDYKTSKCTDCGDGCQDMGYYVSHNARGTYYLQTSYHFPYCAGTH